MCGKTIIFKIAQYRKKLKRIIIISNFASSNNITIDDEIIKQEEQVSKSKAKYDLEPNEESVAMRWTDNQYAQINGSTDELHKFADETFDMIICHNVLEYAEDRAYIVKEFARILKTDGKISIVKHNRAGRVMQMVVLLNDFEHAHSLLDGNDGMASKYGAIHYYEDADIEKWCPELVISKILGMRTFWDMQQNQEIHKEADWQDKMVEIDIWVCDMDGYKDIAFFHHLIIEKKGITF